MKEKLMGILKELKPEVDFEQAEALIDDAILDSFDLVSLVGEINDVFEIEISFDEIEPENFNSVASILELIEKLS